MDTIFIVLCTSCPALELGRLDLTASAIINTSSICFFYSQNSNGMMQPHLHPREHINHGHLIQHEGDEFIYRPTDQRQVEGREDFGEMVDGNRARPQQHFIQYNHLNKNMEVVSTTSESLLSPHSSKASYRQSYPPQKVHYSGIENRLKSDRTNHHDPLVRFQCAFVAFYLIRSIFFSLYHLEKFSPSTFLLDHGRHRPTAWAGAYCNMAKKIQSILVLGVGRSNNL